MDRVEEQVQRLVTEACGHPAGSRPRQRNLTRLIRLIANKLWKENTPYYEDALQQTWVYFCQNICEGNTGEAYNPSRGSVLTWLNTYLKRRLQDFYIETKKQQATRFMGRQRQLGRDEDSETADPLDNFPASPDPPPLLEEVRAWAETDQTGELRRTRLQDHPQVTAQILILRRLPPETSWKALAAELGVPASTLSSFYQRQCLPCLRKFGESEGYIE
jgi:DNA-directed RNA polymerase specialized sigma24 family protein